MTLRPEPVTSKFRKNKFEEFYARNFNPIEANNSSDGSTESLISILYRDRNDDNLSINNKDSHENYKESDSEDLSAFNFVENKGISREILKTVGNNCNISHNPSELYSQDKICKRTIARKPDYPGSSIIQVKCNSMNYDINKTSTKRQVKKYSPIETDKQQQIMKTNSNQNNSQPSGHIKRKIIRSSSENNGQFSKNRSGTSEDVDKYSTDQFESGSEADLKKDLRPRSVALSSASSSNAATISLRSTCNSALSYNVDVNAAEGIGAGGGTGVIIKPLNAWEAWFMKKENHKRKQQQIEMNNKIKEKELFTEKERQKEEKRKETEEKIHKWLEKKEAERLKNIQIQKQQKKLREIKRQEKEDKLKKFEDKLKKWNIDKQELDKKKAQERQDAESMRIANEMIKKAKGETAFNEWIALNKDHQAPVPYSYGISDGKLTSYYDKTSNPPPSYFNPNPWVT